MNTTTDELSRAALEYHEFPVPGKISVTPTKQLSNQRDLALAYSPGVAAASEAIYSDPAAVFRYTARGNLIGVITNGTAVLGLGAIGPLAAKPVMEGKAVLFKKFAGIDVFDIEINERDPDKLVDIIASLEPTFGGINLEDIKAPECFYIEKQLRSRMKIPVFHDDQHGTAIIVGAAVLNGLKVVGKDIARVKLVCSGAGAAALACLDLLVSLGLSMENIWVSDIKGVVYRGRKEEMDDNKARYAKDTKARTLTEILPDADIFLGLSAARVLKPEMLKQMGTRPLILALANPTPEILPDEAKAVRPDAIIATGRSDYPNQVNNVLCFPYIFRGALDVGATTITEQMKLAPAVALAAMESGVATRPIHDFVAYHEQLLQFVYHSGLIMKPVFSAAKKNPTRVVFCEGEDERVLRAVQIVVDEGVAKPILIARPEVLIPRMERYGLRIRPGKDFEIVNPNSDPRFRDYWQEYYSLVQRRGISVEYAKREVTRRTTLIGALMVRRGDADAMLCGTIAQFSLHVEYIATVIGLRKGVNQFAAMNMLILPKRTLFICDTYVNPDPTETQLAEIAMLAADEVQRFGIVPRIALLSHSNFGSSRNPSAQKMSAAREILEQKAPHLEVEGEMHGDAALNEEIRMRLFPNSRLKGEANLLIMPTLDAANISFNLLKITAGEGITVGPMLLGAAKPVHILTPTATVRRLVNMAALASVDAAWQRQS